MSKKKKVLISGSIISQGEDYEKKQREILKILDKSFLKREISNIHLVEEYTCFNIGNASCIPLLISFFMENLQLYVNDKMVDMRMLK